MELIDRRKLVDDFWKGVEDGSVLSYEDTDNLMENAPTVDAVEVVHGWWDDSQFGFRYCDAVCSVCKSHSNSFYNYCPNCGAKMDGDGNDI